MKEKKGGGFILNEFSVSVLRMNSMAIVLFLVAFIGITKTEETCEDSWRVDYEVNAQRLVVNGSAGVGAKIHIHIQSLDSTVPKCAINRTAESEISDGKFTTAFSLCSNMGYSVNLSIECVIKDSKEIIIWTPPDAPSNVKAEQVTDSSFLLKWDSPTGSITAYKIELNDEIFLQNNRETFYQAAHLKSNTHFTVKVSAKGKEKWSEPSHPIVVGTERSLHPPVLEHPPQVTNTTVVLSWEDRGDLLLYTVKWHQDGAVGEHGTTHVSTIKIENLTPFTFYNFYVRVSDGKKVGNWSDVVRVQTKPGVPFPPRNVTEKAKRSRNISLEWEEPQPSRGDVISYSVTWKTLYAAKRSLQPSHILSTNETWIVMVGLKPARTYVIQVSASTLAGMGNWTEPLSITTLSEPPFPPSNIKVTGKTENSLSLKWDYPNRKTQYTGKIELFTIQWNTIDSQNMSESWNTTEVTCTIKDLIPFTVYYIRMKSWNDAGTGNWSDDIEEKTAAGVPSQPRNFQNTSFTNSSIEMMWDEPFPKVGIILHYKIKWMNLKTKKGLDEEVLNRSYVIIGLTPYTNYSIQVQAETDAGYGNWSDLVIIQTKDGVPSAPKKVREKKTSDLDIEVEWDTPVPNVGPIITYRIQWTDLKTNSSKKMGKTKENIFLIGNLNSFNNYSIRVQAETSAGAGNWSHPITIQTDIGVPYVPRKLMKGHVTNITIEVKWEEPQPYRGPIESYTILWGSHNDTTNKLEYMITDLTPYTEYNISVRARTEAGFGNWSDVLIIKTNVGIPSPPINLRRKDVKNTSIEIEWDIPVPDVGPIKLYRVRWTNTTSHMHETTNTVYLIKDLNPFTNYSIEVQAETAAGPGNWSEPVSIRTSVGIPSTPVKLMQSHVTNITIEVKWEEPQPYRGPIESYTILWGSHNDTTHKLEYIITDLTPYTDYNISVRARTEAGFGSWSDVLTIKTNVGIPSPPINLRRKDVKNTSIEIEWDIPVPEVGPIKLYRVRWTNTTSHMHETTNTVYLMKDLNPFTNYLIDVQAETAAGPGNWSEPASIRTSVGIPSTPEKLMQSHVTNITIEVKWEEPQPYRGPIEFYTILWDSHNETTHELKYLMTDLNPYTDYNISVRAKTEAGQGRWSNLLKVKTKIGIPSIPRNVSDEDKNATYLRLTWLQPNPMNGPLHFYRVQWSAVDDDRRQTALTIDTNFEFFTLLPYTDYNFQVSASSVEGWGKPSVTFTTRTGIAVPPTATITFLKVENSSDYIAEWRAVAHFPGPTTFRLYVWKWPGQCDGGGRIHDVLNGTKSRNEWKQPTKMWISELNAYSRYSVSVLLKTEAGERKSNDSEPIDTPVKVPGPPTNVRANCEGKSTEADVSWSLPLNPNSKITHYFVEYGTEILGYREISVKVNDVCQVQKITLRGLRPERDYRIFVRAVGEGVAEEGERATSSCLLPAGVPPIGNPQWIRIHSMDPSHLTVIWNDIVFSDAMGSLIEYSVIIGIPESMGPSSQGKVAGDVPSWANYSSGLSKFYQATPTGWNPFLKSDEDPLKCIPLREDHVTLQCTLGLESNCGMNRSRCNAPLKADTHYVIKLRAFTRGGYSEAGPLAATTTKYPKSDLIGGLVGGFLVICCFLIFGVFLMKRKGGFEHVRKIIESRILHPTFVTSQPEICVELESYQHGRCIKIHNFCEHVRIMLSDSHLKFSEEFETLKSSSPKFPCTAAEMKENCHKNRWMNIFPYDHSRVKLLPLGDEPASDFINANYIVGDSSLREYIASQGPLANTVDDFWRMIWEQSATMIVMLTQLVERGKVKCEKYWPDEKEPKYYGDIQVRLISESMLSSYIIRVFHVQLGSQERIVKQMHFTHWPDFGCPERPEDLINFVTAVRDHLPRIRPGPIVVHCSAGVGRTGTFISVDRLAQNLQHINIFETVMELRQHRINMVQTEDQYIYIHLCVQQLVQEMIQPRKQECNEPIYSNVSRQKDTGV